MSDRVQELELKLKKLETKINFLNTEIERKDQKIEKLQNSKTRIHHTASIYRKYVENINHVLWTINLATGKFTYVSPSVNRLLEMTVEEAMEFDFDNNPLNPPSYFEAQCGIKQQIFDFMNGQGTAQTRKYELQQPTKSGHLKWLDLEVNILTDDKNNPIELLSVSTNIEEKKQFEKQIRESEAQLQLIADSAINWESFRDKNGKVVYCSPAFESITGYSKEDYINGIIEIKDMAHPDDYPMVKAAYERSYFGEQTPAFIFRIIKPNQKIIFVEAIINPVHTRANEFIGLRASIRDITIQKKSELMIQQQNIELSKLNNDKNKFFSIIAHDLKTPFNTILGFSEILIEKVSDDKFKSLQEFALLINQSASRTMDLLTNLMEWVRSQTGRIVYAPNYFDLVELIEEVSMLSNDAATQKSIHISKKLPQSSIVFADREMIGTVLRNLISNAIKFTHLNGEIIISIEINSIELIVSVSDNGVGLTKSRIERLFHIDENQSTSGTMNEKGTGLGLLLCQEFVEKHGGRIMVGSEVGKGSQFKFTLPIVAE